MIHTVTIHADYDGQISLICTCCVDSSGGFIDVTDVDVTIERLSELAKEIKHNGV